jgi:hypothetical protein
MHVHLPKPLHGWRAFVGEVGIIVLGVLIALAFEQLVGRWQWRERVAETRAQLDEELNRDARSAYEGLAVIPCLDQQLVAIDTALASARQTGRLQPTPAFTPPLHMFTEDTWLNARALQVADHLSARQIQDYSRLFFYPRDLGVAVVELHKEGAELRPLRTGLSPISTEEVGDYQRQTGRVRELLNRVELGEALLLAALKQRGIRPTRDEMAQSLEADRQWAGECVTPPDPDASFRRLADSLSVAV